MVLANHTLYGLVEALRDDALFLSEVPGLRGRGKKRSAYGADIIKILNEHHTNNPR
jgi:hypothetical protein